MNKLIVALTLGLIALPAQAQVRTDWHALCPIFKNRAEMAMIRRQNGDSFEENLNWLLRMTHNTQQATFTRTMVLYAYSDRYPLPEDPEEKARIVSEFGEAEDIRCRSWDPL